MDTWARENPDEFAILQDLAAFDADFFATYSSILFAKQQTPRSEDGAGVIGDGLVPLADKPTGNKLQSAGSKIRTVNAFGGAQAKSDPAGQE